MRDTTVITVGGQVREVIGTYDDIKGILAARTLTEDDGMRQLRTVEGDDILVNRGAVAMVERARETGYREAIGFR